MKSKHKHQYSPCLIKETRVLGHKEYLNWLVGGQCSICGKLRKVKWLWFGAENNYDLPIVEDFVK